MVLHSEFSGLFFIAFVSSLCSRRASVLSSTVKTGTRCLIASDFRGSVPTCCTQVTYVGFSSRCSSWPGRSTPPIPEPKACHLSTELRCHSKRKARSWYRCRWIRRASAEQLGNHSKHHMTTGYKTCCPAHSIRGSVSTCCKLLTSDFPPGWSSLQICFTT